MSDLTTNIESEAAKAATVTNDGVTVGRRSISELIAADKYLKANDAAASISDTVKNIFSRIVPPGGSI